MKWDVCFAVLNGHWSPSSRRAWIEMLKGVLVWLILLVALLAEGVD